MKIYFSYSLSQKDETTISYVKKIVENLKGAGHKVFPDKLFEKSSDYYLEQTAEESLKAQKQLTKYKKMADLIVLEVTKQSLGIGQEIALAVSMNKPVVVMYQEGHEPHILRDEGGDLILFAPYTDKTLEKVLDNALQYASNNQDVRFNFFISPAIGNYLDWISRVKKIPRSVYLRNLIEEDMDNNEEFHQ